MSRFNPAKPPDFTKQNILQPTVDLLNMRDSIAFPSGVGLVAFRFDDNDASFYNTAYPLLKARAMPATLSFVANKVGTWPTRDKCTDAQIIEMCQYGFELASHSYTHGGTDPATLNAINHEIIDSKNKWEADIGFTVRNFVQPGSWPTYTTPVDNQLANIIKQNYTFYEGYHGDDLTNRPNFRTFGYNHKTSDDVALATLEGWIDQISGKNKALIILTHHVGETYSGTTPAIFTSLLDYIKTKRDAGLLEVVTDSGLMAARIGTPIDYVYNGGFEAETDGYTVVGTPTLVTSGAHSGTNCYSLDGSNYLRFTLKSGEYESHTYRLKGWHKTESSGTARFIAVYSTGGTRTMSMASSGTWQALEMCLQTPRNGNIIVWLQPSAGTVLYDDISLTRIG